jgi:hypothetical protein
MFSFCYSYNKNEVFLKFQLPLRWGKKSTNRRFFATNNFQHFEKLILKKYSVYKINLIYAQNGKDIHTMPKHDSYNYKNPIICVILWLEMTTWLLVHKTTS